MKSFEEVIETTRLVRNALWQYVYELGHSILGYINMDCKCGGDSSCRLCYGTGIFTYAVVEAELDNGYSDPRYFAFIDGNFVIWADKDWTPLSIWPEKDYQHYALVVGVENRFAVPVGPFKDLKEVGAYG